jgi:hypothetical protein
MRNLGEAQMPVEAPRGAVRCIDPPTITCLLIAAPRSNKTNMSAVPIPPPRASARTCTECSTV